MTVQLRLHIEGPKGGISFQSFVTLLDRSRKALDDIDRVLSRTGRGAVYWTVSDLGTNSLDAVITGNLRPRSKAPDRLPKEVAAGFVSGIGLLEAGDELPPYFSNAGLDQIRYMSHGLSKNGATGVSACLLEEDLEARVTARAEVNIERLLIPSYTAIGSIVGRLETVSVHGGTRFETYDDLSRRAVRSAFSPERLDEVKAALGCRVMVSGVVYRNVKGQPVKIEQSRLTPLPKESALPTIEELVGLDPDFTGGAPVDDYMRRVRDA